MCNIGKCPYRIINYTSFQNPYIKKFGGHNWIKEVENCTFMKPYMSIKNLLRKKYDASEKVFKGTPFEDEWLVYHDMLNLMTAISTIRWMKEVNIYKRWLLSKNNLNGGTTYSGRPVGNSPEFMPLDNALNNDIQQSLSLHCAITLELDDNDERKFSMRTPNEISKGIRRIFQEG